MAYDYGNYASYDQYRQRTGISDFISARAFNANPVAAQSAMVQDFTKIQRNAGDLQSNFTNQVSGTNEATNTLPATTSSFLADYTESMNNLYSAGAALSNGGVDNYLYNDAGEVTEETVDDTVSAVKSLVDEYNETVTNLQDNADRGVGAQRQLERMEQAPVSRQELDALGITRGEDGTLALDEEKLAATLNTAAQSESPKQLDFLRDVISGEGGFADSIRRSAEAGLNQSSASLISNDYLRSVQGGQSAVANPNIDADDPFSQLTMYSRSGSAQALGNLAATGMFLNMIA